MKILFLSLLDFESIEENNIYTDLLREFRRYGHELFVVSPIERRKNRNTYVIKGENCSILKLKIGNVQKTSYIEKGISLLRLQGQFIKGILNFFEEIHFDLVLYATPPITLQKVVKTIKKRDHAITYLLLKDIWPQGIVDLGILKPHGMMYSYFRRKEKDIYKISDFIGCMSENNVRYLLKHEPWLDSDKMEVCPNSIDVLSHNDLTEEEKNSIKKEMGFPLNKLILLYGGNLGKPQGLDFLLQAIVACESLDCFFLIVGDGTEYQRIKNAVDHMDKGVVKLIKFLPNKEYNKLAEISDVGLVFLNPSFTVPNIPSRMLSYMNASLPILAATDECTDLKKIIEEGKMGYWCKNGDMDAF